MSTTAFPFSRRHTSLCVECLEGRRLLTVVGADPGAAFVDVDPDARFIDGTATVIEGQTLPCL